MQPTCIVFAVVPCVFWSTSYPYRLQRLAGDVAEDSARLLLRVECRTGSKEAMATVGASSLKVVLVATWNISRYDIWEEQPKTWELLLQSYCTVSIWTDMMYDNNWIWLVHTVHTQPTQDAYWLNMPQFRFNSRMKKVVGNITVSEHPLICKVSFLGWHYMNSFEIGSWHCNVMYTRQHTAKFPCILAGCDWDMMDLAREEAYFLPVQLDIRIALFSDL